jgi:CxxC motif-containing protein (DUF1111 family)
MNLIMNFNSTQMHAMHRPRAPRFLTLLAFLALGHLAACSDGDDDGPPIVIGTGDPSDQPINHTPEEWIREFDRGDELFDLALRNADGLGPLYTRVSCGGCHAEASRGPGLVLKMSVVEADGITPAADQSMLGYGHTVHPLVTAGATTPIVPPEGVASVHVSTRVGPPVFGRGYMEAIPDAEIERVAAEQAGRDDGIHGRVNYVAYASQPNPDTRFHTYQPGDQVIGRFGLKARIATLDDFAADALAGDMGITSPLRPVEFANPDGLVDDDKPGIDVTIESVNFRANYTRLLAIPRRDKTVVTGKGATLFESTRCAVCHQPSMRTRADYPVPTLADVDAPVYSDLLIHDMGDDLADGLGTTDGDANAREWRTAPLIGIRFSRTYLHDGRADNLRDAVLAHDSAGSEAHDSITRFLALPDVDQQLLLDFVDAL